MSVEGVYSKHLKVEKAKEFESFRYLPRFEHVPMAVIHPSPRKKRIDPSPPKPNLTLTASPAKLGVRRYEPKQIPDH